MTIFTIQTRLGLMIGNWALTVQAIRLEKMREMREYCRRGTGLSPYLIMASNIQWWSMDKDKDKDMGSMYVVSKEKKTWKLSKQILLEHAAVSPS